jgi:hypothetical protein
MALPGNVDLITVTGTFQFIDSTYPGGTSTVEFSPSGNPWLKDASADAILLPKTVVCTVNATGQLVGPAGAVGAGGLGVKLPATDDADLAPTGFVYNVVIKITGLAPLAYSISLPTSDSTVDLADLAPVSPVEGGGDPLVLSVNGNLPNSSGAVTLDAADVDALPSSYTAPVLSVNGATGAIVIDTELPRPAVGLTNAGALAAYSAGPYVIDAPGLYQNLDVDSFDVRAGDVTIRNCRLRGTDAGGNLLGRAANFHAGWDSEPVLRRRTIEHCEIKGTLIGGGFTARYNDSHHMVEDGATLTRSDEPTVIEWSDFRDFTPSEGNHADGIQLIQAPSADVVIRHNRVICDPPGDYSMPPINPFNAAMFVGTADVPIPDEDPNPAKIGHIYVEDNLLLSQYSAYVVRVGGPNTHLVGNQVGPGTTGRTYLTVTTEGSGNRQVTIAGVDLALPVLDEALIGDSSPYLTQATADSLYGADSSLYPLAAYGLKATSVAIEDGTVNGAPGAGVAVWQRVRVPQGTPITGAAMFVESAGSTPGGGIQGFAVYEEDGTLAGSSTTDNAIFTSTGWRSKALTTPIAAQPDGRFVYVAFVSNLGSAPTLTSAADAKALNGAVGGGNRRCFYAASVTSWPGTITVSSHGTLSTQTNLIGVY